MIDEKKERELYDAYIDDAGLFIDVGAAWEVWLAAKRHADEDAEKWLPIESAPRHAIADNVWLLGINMNGSGPHRPFLMRNTFEPNEQFTHAAPGACWQEPGKDWPCYPTHWRPLPPPPAQEGGGA